MAIFIASLILAGVHAGRHASVGVTVEERAYERFGQDFVPSNDPPTFRRGTRTTTISKAGRTTVEDEGAWKRVTVVGEGSDFSIATKIVHAGKVVQYDKTNCKAFMDRLGAIVHSNPDGSEDLALNGQTAHMGGLEPVVPRQERVIDGVLCTARSSSSSTGSTQILTMVWQSAEKRLAETGPEETYVYLVQDGVKSLANFEHMGSARVRRVK